MPADLFCLASTGLFFSYTIGRTLTSPVEYLARTDLLMVLGALMAYSLVALLLTTPKLRLWIVATFLLLGVVNAGIGIMQAIRREPFCVFDFVTPGQYGLRATGLYVCPNHLAGFLEVGALLGISVACWSRIRLWLKIVAVYAALMCLTGVILSGSRGGYLSTIAGLAMFAILSLIAIRRGAPEWFKLAAAAAVGLFAALAFVGISIVSSQATIQARVEQYLVSGPEDDARTDLWRAASRQFHLNPWIGTGAETYQFYGRFFRAPSIWGEPEYAHNDYLQLLAEFGAVGGVLFLIFLVTHLAAGWRGFRWFVTERAASKNRLQSDALALTIGAFSSVVAYMVHSVVDFNLHIPANALLMAVVFALLANPGVATPLKSFRFPETNRYTRLALPALGIWVIVTGLIRFPAEYYAERARLAWQDDHFDDAIRWSEKALEFDKTNPAIYHTLGRAQLERAENSTESATRRTALEAAAVAFQSGLKLYPQDKWLLLGLGWSLDGLERYDEARPIFRRAVSWDPNSFMVHFEYAEHLRKAGKLAEAKAQYEKSLAVTWNHAAHLGLQRLTQK